MIRRTDFLLVITYVSYRKRAYFGTSTAVPHVVYGTVHTRMIRTTGTYYGSSYRMIPAAFHGHTLTGMRVPVLQNEDSSCSIRECNTSSTATPNISDVCTAGAVDTACARGSVLLITYWYTSMCTYKGTVSRNERIGTRMRLA